MILPSKQDRGIVVFLLLPSLGYEMRLVISFALIIVGILVQYITQSFPLGFFAILAGNLLLLVKGYDNRVDVKAFDADAHWERAELEKLQELKVLDKSIRRWDRSLLDFSNPLGAVVFVLLVVGCWFAAMAATGFAFILVVDAVVLLFPHWFTGIRKTLRLPGLLVRVDAIDAILDRAKRRLKDHDVSLLMLLGGGDAKLPEDVKFKVDIANHHDDFLGLYGQVVINEVQGTSHPYFYAVLVARKGFGLRDAWKQYNEPSELTKEFKYQGEVEVMVIRQTTTKTSGYATKPADAANIFFEGLSLAESVAVG